MTDIKRYSEARKKCGRSDEDLAALIGLSEEAYFAKISGKAEFTGSEIIVLSSIFDRACGYRISEDIFFARRVD